MNINKIFNCIIVDDEERCIEQLKKYIESIPYLNLLNTYNNSITALKEISVSKDSIHFLFLDVEMPNLSGLDLAASVRHKVDKLIFATSHSRYSLEAYNVMCNQYLLKPFSQQTFTIAINRLIELSNKENNITKESVFFIKLANNGNYLKILNDEIVSVNAMEHYITIQTTNSKYTQHTSLKEVEKQLLVDLNFMRVHKSHIVSKRHIVSVRGNSIIMSNQTIISIGSTYRKNVYHYLESNTL